MSLAGCQAPGRLAPEFKGPAPPPGTPRIREAVDGLVVAHRLMAAGQYELALRAYYLAVSQHGLNADILSGIGSADLKLGRLGQAEHMLRSALALDPGFVPALNNLGVVLMNENRIPEARAMFQKAFALDSGRSDLIRKNLGLAMEKMNRSSYDPNAPAARFSLVRRGDGRYLLLRTKDSADGAKTGQ